MTYDYLVESTNREVLHLLPRTDDLLGLHSAVTAERLPRLLAETNLENSFVAEYASQLALRGAVDRDLLIVEGQAITEELSTLSQKMRMVEVDPEDGSGFLYKAEMPEDEEILITLRDHYGLKVLDRNGYSDPDLSLFDIEEPSTLQGSFIKPGPVWKYFFRVGEGVPSMADLGDNPATTHCMEQYAVTRDEQGAPIHISAQRSIVVGFLNESGEFVPHSTLQEPFKH